MKKLFCLFLMVGSCSLMAMDSFKEHFLAKNKLNEKSLSYTTIKKSLSTYLSEHPEASVTFNFNDQFVLVTKTSDGIVFGFPLTKEKFFTLDIPDNDDCLLTLLTKEFDEIKVNDQIPYITYCILQVIRGDLTSNQKY